MGEPYALICYLFYAVHTQKQATYRAQISPEKVDSRKVDSNFLGADFEYFWVLEVGDL